MGRVRKDTLSTIRGFVAKTVGQFKFRGRGYAQCQRQSTSLIGDESNNSWPMWRDTSGTRDAASRGPWLRDAQSGIIVSIPLKPPLSPLFSSQRRPGPRAHACREPAEDRRRACSRDRLATRRRAIGGVDVARHPVLVRPLRVLRHLQLHPDLFARLPAFTIAVTRSRSSV